MIENDEQLREAVQTLNGLMQQISDYANNNPGDATKIRFPRGYLRTAQALRQRFPFIEDRRLKANLSYALMTHDVLRWLITRTDIAGQAEEMIIKEGVCLLGSVCEAITIFPNEYGLGRGAGFARRIARLNALGVIDDDQQTDLNWLWSKRTQEHIIDNLFYEFSHYRIADWHRSVTTYHALRRSLTQWRVPPP